MTRRARRKSETKTVQSQSEELDVSISGPLLPSKADVRADLPGGRVRATSGYCRHSPNGRYGMCSRADHSGLMPANLITLAHFSVSFEMNFPKSAGVIGIGTPPRSVSRCLILARAACQP